MSEPTGADRDVYYIAAHNKAYQLEWLLTAIDNDRDVFLLHIDRNATRDDAADLAAVASRFPRVTLLPRRRIRWGTWSLVGAEIAAIRYALAQGEWRYFISLSAQDYPIVAEADLRASLSSSWPRSWIRVWSLADIAQSEPDDPHLRRRVVVPLRGRRFELPLRVARPAGLELDYKGSNWHMLSRPFCEWLASSPTARRIARILRFSIVPDETYFQAALMSSPFADDRMPDSGRFVIWPGPKILALEDLEAIEGSHDAFARKFDESIDRNVLMTLAERHGRDVPKQKGSAAA